MTETVSKDIQSIFNHHVKEKSYVLQNTKCPSLGAIVISAQDIKFFTEDGKLRASITDFSKQKYDMKVSCKYLRDIFERTKDVDKLNGMVSQAQYAHCRIGLARKFLIQENHSRAELEKKLNETEIDTKEDVSNMNDLVDVAGNVRKIMNGSTNAKKRELLNLLLSNAELDDTTLCFYSKKPFDKLLFSKGRIFWWEWVDSLGRLCRHCAQPVTILLRYLSPTKFFNFCGARALAKSTWFRTCGSHLATHSQK